MGESLEFESGAVDGSENRYPDMVDEGRLGEWSRSGMPQSLHVEM